MDHYYLTIEQLPVDTVEIEMKGDTFYYSKNRNKCYEKVFVTHAYGSRIHKQIFKHEAYRVFMSDFHINNIPEVEENRKMYEHAEKVRNEDWHDKYNELWGKYIFYKDECRALKEQINKIQESQTENEMNSK